MSPPGLVVVNSSPSWGGNEFWSVRVARGLADRGHAVRFVWCHDVVGERVAAAGLGLLKERRVGPGFRLAVVFVLLGATLAYSTRLVGFLEDLLYQDSIVYARSTPYQRIVLTRWRDDVRLYLNGNIQFSAIDEARYHEALVLPAMTAEEALAAARTHAPARAVVDLKLEESSGLDLVPELKALVPGMVIVILTGYASIATAVLAAALSLLANQELKPPALIDFRLNKP